MWWIKASIQEYILRSWSLVKIGTTTAQKKLTNLKRQFLHAKTIGFILPKKNKEMIFNSILPQELEIILKSNHMEDWKQLILILKSSLNQVVI